MRSRIATICALALASSYFLFSALPAFSAGSGTIVATVTAASPCITIGTASVDFGTVGFSTSSSFGSKVLTGASSYTNCSSSQESITARGTDAHNAASTVTWSLNPAPGGTCSTTNVYTLTISSATTPGNGGLDRTDKAFETAAAGATSSLNPGIVMPCTGSSGAGEEMTFQYVLTASF